MLLEGVEGWLEARGVACRADGGGGGGGGGPDGLGSICRGGPPEGWGVGCRCGLLAEMT